MNVIWKRSYSLKKNKSSTSLLLEDTAFHFKNFFLIKKLKKVQTINKTFLAIYTNYNFVLKKKVLRTHASVSNYLFFYYSLS